MAEESLITDEMKKMIGVESKPVVAEVEKGSIKRFAEALEDGNPLWQDEAKARKAKYGGIIAPPTFLRTMGEDLEMETLSKIPLKNILDGGSEWEYFEPVRSGDQISVTFKVVELKEREGRMGKMVIMTGQYTYTNQFGEVVATQRPTAICY